MLKTLLEHQDKQKQHLLQQQQVQNLTLANQRKQLEQLLGTFSSQNIPLSEPQVQSKVITASLVPSQDLAPTPVVTSYVSIPPSPSSTCSQSVGSPGPVDIQQMSPQTISSSRSSISSNPGSPQQQQSPPVSPPQTSVQQQTFQQVDYNVVLDIIMKGLL